MYVHQYTYKVVYALSGNIFASTLVFQTELELHDVGSLELAVIARGDLELDLGALVERLVAVHLDLAPVHEQVLATFLGDEAVAFFRVEPLHSTLRHFNPSLSPLSIAEGVLLRAAWQRHTPSLRGHGVNYTTLFDEKDPHLSFCYIFGKTGLKRCERTSNAI